MTPLSEGPDGRVDLIGQGRVGTALRGRLAAIGRLGQVVDRAGPPLSVDRQGPALVCTRNDDLEAVLEAAPPSRRLDLVFVQNGMLEPWLTSKGLAGATRGLLFFAAASRGEDALPGPEPSPFCGPHAAWVVGALEHAGIPSREVDRRAFDELALEKLVWNCAFGVLCEALDESVGGACGSHPGAVEALCSELIEAGASALGLSVDLALMVERLVAYSLSIPEYRGAVKEWRWRNGWFATLDRALPEHEAALRQAGRDPRSGEPIRSR